MILLKIIGKILLVPVWIMVAMIWLIVKLLVSIYSFARGFMVLILGALLFGTMFYYHDIRQIIFLLGIYGMTFAVLFIGITIEVGLENAREIIGKYVFGV